MTQRVFFLVVLVSLWSWAPAQGQKKSRKHDQIQEYLIMGQENQRAGGIRVTGLGRGYHFAALSVWGQSHGVVPRQDRPPFINSQVRIMQRKSVRLEIINLSLLRDNYLCLDVVQFLGDKQDPTSLKGRLIVRVGQQRLRSFALVVPENKRDEQAPCLSLNPYARPGTKLAVTLEARYSEPQFWAFYDIYLVHSRRS